MTMLPYGEKIRLKYIDVSNMTKLADSRVTSSSREIKFFRGLDVTKVKNDLCNT
jgi:hypothetical protein